MELKQLDALAAVAEHGRFSAAARALDTVQSNISTHIARLEDDLGALLVDRSAGELTPEGQVVLTRARRINTELAALRDDVASMTSRVTGRVRIGIIGTTGRWLLPPLLDELNRSFPDVVTTVIDATTTALIPLLEHGDLDLAVLNTPLQHDELFTSPMFEEQLVVIAPQGHELSAEGDRSIHISELTDHQLLLSPPGSNLRALIDEAAQHENVQLQTVAELDGIRLAATLAFQGYAPAIVPVTAIPSWVARGEWTVLSLQDMAPRHVGLAVRRRGMLSAPASATRDVLRQMVREVAPTIDGLTAV
ncbi:MAG: LysR family transcriptional regulator [Acidimicrobiales bacterium]|nr:LysR family transcriptional regulator [Acidimicrobiales bacterium]